jgi:hypothetical protein
VRTTADTVVRIIPWPHLGVVKGPARKPATYGSLTLSEIEADKGRGVFSCSAWQYVPFSTHQLLASLACRMNGAGVQQLSPPPHTHTFQWKPCVMLNLLADLTKRSLQAENSTPRDRSHVTSNELSCRQTMSTFIRNASRV